MLTPEGSQANRGVYRGDRCAQPPANCYDPSGVNARKFRRLGAESIRILLTASEVVGFAKTGGLADVAGALPPALARRGHDCAVVLPLYRCARSGKIPVEPTPHRFRVPVGDRAYEGRIWQSRLPGSDVPVYLIEQPDFFDRDNPALGHGIYQFTPTSGGKRDY